MNCAFSPHILLIVPCRKASAHEEPVVVQEVREDVAEVRPLGCAQAQGNNPGSKGGRPSGHFHGHDNVYGVHQSQRALFTK